MFTFSNYNYSHYLLISLSLSLSAIERNRSQHGMYVLYVSFNSSSFMALLFIAMKFIPTKQFCLWNPYKPGSMLYRWGSSGFQNSGIKENLSQNTEFFAISRRNDGIFHPYRTRIFSKMISGMQNFHEISWICRSFVCCLVKRGCCHIFVFLVSSIKISSKLCSRILTAILLLFPHGWKKTLNSSNLCHHFDDEGVRGGTLVAENV